MLSNWILHQWHFHWGNTCLFLPPTTCTVQTVAADLRRGEHIPKMQNNIGRESQLHVLRQLRSKDGGVLDAVPCRAVPRGARPGAAFCTTAVDLSCRSKSAASSKNTVVARTYFLRNSNLSLYQLRHAFLAIKIILGTSFNILYYTNYSWLYILC
jgi:hypothetical protein